MNVTLCLSGSQISLVAHVTACILPQDIEASKFKNIQEWNRLCEMCDLGEWGESSFVLYCTNCDDLRELLLHEMLNQTLICSGMFMLTVS